VLQRAVWNPHAPRVISLAEPAVAPSMPETITPEVPNLLQQFLAFDPILSLPRLGPEVVMWYRHPTKLGGHAREVEVEKVARLLAVDPNAAHEVFLSGRWVLAAMVPELVQKAGRMNGWSAAPYQPARPPRSAGDGT